MTATNSALLKQNYVTIDAGATGCSAFQLNSDFNSLLNCNGATGNDASGGTGFDISDAESTGYSCNSTTGTGTGVYFKMGSFCPEAFQETTFDGDGVGLKVSSSATIGPQTHKGNTWNGTFGSFGAQHESSDPQFWQQSPFTIHTNTGVYYPTLPMGQGPWFPVQPGTPDDDCGFIACAQAWGYAEKFGLDDGIAGYTFTTSSFPTEIGWLAKRYLYRKLNRNPSLITPNSAYETFYNNEASSTVGQFVNINLSSSAIYGVDPVTASQLNSGFSAIVTSMEAIGLIDSQLVAVGFDSVLVQQRLQEMQNIEIAEANADTLSGAIIAQRVLGADAIVLENSGIATNLVFESNKYAVNDIYLSTVAKDILEFNQIQTDTLMAIAFQCPLTGGSAVYEARSLLAMALDTVYNDSLLCSGVDNRGSGKVGENKENGFSLFPNPAKQEVNVLLPGNSLQNGKVVISNAMGIRVVDRPIRKGDVRVTIKTSSLAPGFYLLTIFDSKTKIFSEQLVIIH